MSKAKLQTTKTPVTKASAAPLKGIAIIGMSCRVPGANNYRDFWRNLCDGVESVTVFTDEELIAAGISPAEIAEPDYVKTAFRIPGIDKFDAAFFEYSPREVRLMDPQHRILLEVGWEAFEDAGYIPGRHLGPVGIVLGTGGNVSSYMVNELYDHPESRGRTANLVHIGNDKDFASTRLSFKFDLTGPSLNVQTACSTSLIAVHLACQSIQTGECTMALAGGATVRVPEISGYRSVRGGLYSPDGHVRTFDADARGTVFGSAVGMVLLKEVNQAIADGDVIYAVIKATAINNDGGTKPSYSGSSVPGQAEAMSKALKAADVSPDTIGYAECHGTGTAVGDPIEIAALTEAFKDTPVPVGSCPVGSVKPNIGHPEQAAGIVSLIKTALALHEEQIPPTINIRTLNPKINFATSPFYVNQELKAWPKTDKPRRALVNSLGIGGTNGVVILEEAPTRAPAAQPQPERPAHLLVLSAKSEVALKEALARQAEGLEENPGQALPNVAFALAQGRVGFSHRYSLVAASTDEAIEKLRTTTIATAADRRLGSKRKLGFLFTGQGAQFVGMGKALYASQPLFKQTFDRCAAAMVGLLDRPLTDAVFADPNGPDAGLINQTAYTQPGTFALQVSLATLLASWGIRPTAAAGHSVGEFALAVVAGVYPLEAAAKLIATRGKLMQALPEGGAMAAVFSDEASVRAALAELALPQIGVAAVNGPANTVVSGLKTSVDAVIAFFEPKGITARQLTVSHAFHSVLMEAAMADFRTAVGAATASAPELLWVSTLTGAVKTDAPDADYWVSHAMDAVRFADAVKLLAEQGVTDFLEIGPGKSMLALAQSSVSGDGWAFLPTVTKDGVDGRDLLETIGTLFRRGETIDWKGFDAPWTRRRLPLPTYPFQGERLWNERDGAVTLTQTAQPAASGQGLVGVKLRSSLPEAQFESVYSQKALPWIKDHKVYSHVVLPTTAGLVGLLQAAAKLGGDKPRTIANFSYRAPLFLGETEARITHLVLKPGDMGSFDAQIASAEDADASRWQTHITASLRPAGDSSQGPTFVPEAVISRAKPVPVERYYAALATLGLDYGAAFRGIQSLWQGLGEALAHVRLPDSVAAEDYPLHPALLDAALHTYPAVIDAFGDFTKVTLPPDGMHLPTGIERFSIAKPGERDIWVHLRKRLHDVSADPTTAALVVDIDLFDMSGARIARFEGLALKPLAVRAFQPKAAEAAADWLYQVRWDKLPATAKNKVPAPNAWLILADAGGVGAALAKSLETRHHPVKLIEKSALIPAGAVKVDGRESFAPVLAELAQTWADKRVGIIYLWGIDTQFGAGDAHDLEAQQAAVIGNALHLTQALGESRDSFKAAPTLWLTTRNGLDIRDGSKATLDLAQAGLWGFGRTVSLEYPQVWGGLIDLAAGGTNPAETQALANHLLAGDREAQVAFRANSRYGARFVRAKAPAPRAPVTQDATYLITGGLGAIGVETAKWLITQRGIKHLVLASRRGADDPTAAGIRGELEALGSRISVEKLDTSSEASVKALVAKLRADVLPLKGIYHSAGVLEDATIAQFSWDKFRKAIAPKFDGAWFLHKATEDLSLDDFVVYSSILSLFGAGGQANYTSGNAYLDGLAAFRQQQGKPGLAINWGPWAAGGLATLAGDKGEAIWRARGLIYTKPSEGQDALSVVVAAGFNHAAVLSADWPTLIRQFQTPPTFFADMLGEAKTEGATAGAGVSVEALQAQLKSSDPRERRFAIVTYVAQQAQATLGVNRLIDPGQPLRELGLDSLMAVTLINRIEMALAVRVPAVKLIQGPSIDQLVDEVWPDLAGVGLPPATREQPAAEAAPDTVVPAEVSALVADLISETVEAALAAPALVEGPKWLIPVGKRANPRARLFCFPFAGGGSAVFRPWANWIDPGIEVIAVEPPGRLGRISEKPVNDIDLFVDSVLDEMIDLLDLPFAMFGHCLGAVTMYETARTLIEETRFKPLHLFASGARSPDRVGEVGPFEQELGQVLMSTPGYRSDLKPYNQSDEIFADIIRRFDMAATDQFLSDPELRKLMLPAVRAEFEMTSNYKLKGEPKPWDVPITCFVSRGDPYVSRDDILAWGKFTNQRLQVLMREGTHYAVVEDAQFINRIINREMVMPL
ncbi:MAG: type I polyketide synthase [Elstera sp.]